MPHPDAAGTGEAGTDPYRPLAGGAGHGRAPPRAAIVAAHILRTPGSRRASRRIGPTTVGLLPALPRRTARPPRTRRARPGWSRSACPVRARGEGPRERAAEARVVAGRP